MSTGTVIEHESSHSGRWLRVHRVRAALWIAVLEVVLAAVTASVSKYTIIALGLITIPIFLIWGKDQRGAIRQVSWIAAASQALAIVGVLLSHFIGLFVLVLAGIFAAVALFLIFADRG
jgi:TRAP-type mannitol/chloroaromatic compound transport system permease large subunit